MKKIISLALALVMVLSLTIVMFADDAPTTTLTTTVPPAVYTLNIPEDQTITYGETSTDIGNVTVTDSSGFAKGKNLVVTVTYGSFTSETVTTTIPFLLYLTPNNTSFDTKSLASGDTLVFKGKTSTAQVDQQATATFSTKSGSNTGTDNLSVTSISLGTNGWGYALAGTYTATITFTAEVVVDETT